MDYLFSCSFDNTYKFWKLRAANSNNNNNNYITNIYNFILKDTIMYNNWVNSITVLNYKVNTGEEYVVLSGGINPNVHIKIYSLKNK